MLVGAGSVENALAHNTSGVVIPWIALGCGYRREFDPTVWETFDFGWNYDYIYSWMLGRELNGEWFASKPVRPLYHLIIVAAAAVAAALLHIHDLNASSATIDCTMRRKWPDRVADARISC